MELRESLARLGRRFPRNFSFGLASVVSAGVFGATLIGCGPEPIEQTSFNYPYTNSIPASTNHISPAFMIDHPWVLISSPEDGERIDRRNSFKFIIMNTRAGETYSCELLIDKGRGVYDGNNELSVGGEDITAVSGTGQVPYYSDYWTYDPSVPHLNWRINYELPPRTFPSRTLFEWGIRVRDSKGNLAENLDAHLAVIE